MNFETTSALRAGSQRGAATLVVVMALLLVMGLLGAYANRALLFEQRVATSYYKSAVASEMADSAIDWVAANFNTGQIDGSCQQVASGGIAFKDRYANPNPANRDLRVLEFPQSRRQVNCKRSSTGQWTCRCLTWAQSTEVMQGLGTTADTFQPSFAVLLGNEAPSSVPGAAKRLGVMYARAQGCTSSTIVDCTGASPTATEGNGWTKSLLGLVSAVRTPPATPLTVKGTLSLAGPGLGLHNSDSRSSGLLLLSGKACPDCGFLDSRSDSLPGTPASAAVVLENEWLLAADDLFRKYLGAYFLRYGNHPASRAINCQATSDCGPQLQAAADSGIQMLWVNGPLLLTTAVNLGTATRPVVLAVNGNAVISGPVAMSGLIAVKGNLTWQNTGGTTLLSGMVLVDGDMNTLGNIDINYSRDIADQLRNTVGSLVRLPGSLGGA